VISDNFSFQNNEHMFENNGFFGKTMGFLGKQLMLLLLKSNDFDTTSQMIYFDYILVAYEFYKNKNYSRFTLTFFS